MSSLPDTVESVRAPGLRNRLWVFAILPCVVLALWPSFFSLARYWQDIHDYRHGFLIALVTLTWLWAVRGELDVLELRPQPLAALGLFAALALWLIAFKGNSALAHQMLVLPVLWLAVLTTVGWPLARALLVPLAYFYFAIPVWDHLLPLLQRMTVAAAETGLGVLDIPATIQGTQVTIPEGTFQIVEGCSGGRYFIVSLATATLLGVIAKLSPRRFILLLGCSTALALMANWLRVIIIIYVGHRTHMQHYLIAVEHFTLGWVIFAVLLVAIGFLPRLLSSTPAGPVSGRDVRGNLQPASARTTIRQWVRQRVALGLTFFLLATTAVLISFGPARSLRSSLGALPLLVDRWEGPLPADPQWQPGFLGPREEQRAAYLSSDGTRVEVYFNFYGVQKPGQELVYYENRIAPQEATLTPFGSHGVSLAGLWQNARGQRPAQMLVTTITGERWVASYIYRVGGHTTAVPVLAQLAYGAMALTRETPGGVLVFAARCEVECDKAHKSIEAFWSNQGRTFLALIPSS